MAEIKVIKQVFEKLSEILTVDQPEKITQLFLAKSSEIVPNTRKSNASIILGNFVNLARHGKRNWILDSGASIHVTRTSSEFASYIPFRSICKETIQTVDRTPQPIQGMGIVECTPSITLSSVLYVPSFSGSLVSLSSLVDHMGCHVTLDQENCLIVDRRTTRILGSGIRRNDLWFLDRRIDTPCTALTVSLGEMEAMVILEHCRLGHLSFDTMAKVFPEIMSKVDKRKLVSDACEYGKHTRSIYVSRGLRSISPFMLIHSDVWTCPVISISGMKYIS
jgi:hypothetical protein